MSEIKKQKSFKTGEGKFSVYDSEKDVRTRASMFTVLEDKNGWIVRNSIVPTEKQKQGIATEFYKRMNFESIKKTGKPLRSTQQRVLSNGEVVHELSKYGIALWDSLVKKGYAEKVGNKNYIFKKENTYSSGGEVPTRYKNMGFSKVGEKKKSTRPEKKWMVLAKKGEEYKVVHGGYKGMEDFTQHKDSERRERFWSRMGGENSAKANDKFSPLYWHKKFGTWEKGGEVGVLDDETVKVVWLNSNPEILKSKMFDSIDDAVNYGKSKGTFLVMELENQGGGEYQWKLLPYGQHESYKTALTVFNWHYTIGGF
jgi:hypothetical protein